MTHASNPAGQMIRAGENAIAAPAAWNVASDMWLEGSQESRGFDLRKFLYSLRRRWLPGLLTGLVLGPTVGALLWFFVPKRFEAEGLVRVKLQSSGPFESTALVNEREYAIFKETQAEFVTQKFVLANALRDENIRNLPILRRRNEDPETYLQRMLSVSYPQRSEILRIALWGYDPDQVKRIVDAVMDAYLNEAIQSDRNSITKRLSTMREQKASNNARMSELSQKINKLSEEVGASDSERIKAQQAVEQDQLRTYAEVRRDLRKELNALQGEYVVRRTARQNQVFNPSQAMILNELEKDAEYATAKMELGKLETELAMAAGMVRQGSAMEARAQSQANALRDRMKKREIEMRPRIIEMLKLSYGIDENLQAAELRDLTVRIQLTEQQLEQANKDYKEQSMRLEELFGTSSELFSLQSELENMEEINAEIGQQISRDELSLKTPPRIELLQPARIPPEGNQWLRLLGIIAASLATVVATVGAFTLADYARNIMSAAGELERETNLPVLGKLPAVQGSGRGALGGSARRRDLIIADCVDSIRAALTKGDKSNDVDSVLVTSAVGKEGKSTVASQLAVSLARSGKRTLLVDADIKNPRQHLVFGIPAGRGLSDAIRGEANLEELIQATPAANLWILPAGSWDSATAQGLSGKVVGSILSQLRSQFDFVIIDCAPVLTGCESKIFGQYVSGVLFATRKDHSSLDKVDEAQRQLRSIGIPVLGAVINGAASELRDAVKKLPAK